MEDEFLNIKILYVEDDSNTRNCMKLMLEEYFKNIYIAENGEDGFLQFEKFKPDIVISDIEMPKLNGLNMAKKIKAISNIPIIIMTGFQDERYLLEAIEIGVDGYIKKPIKIDNLLNLIHKQAKNIYLERVSEAISFKESMFQAKLELLKDVSHHWRQPLSAILMVLSDIEDLNCNSFKSCENLLEYLKRVVKKPINLINNLSMDLRKFSNLFLEDIEITKLNLKSEIYKVLELFEDNFKENSILIEVNIKEIEFYSYQNAFRQVLFNIFTNSKEFLNKKSISNRVIKIEALEEKSHIIINICDNAGGIKDEFLNKIFDPYFSTKEIKNYSGLGLFVSKVLIQNSLKGEIFVKNIENGVKFTVKLPKVIENEKT